MAFFQIISILEYVRFTNKTNEKNIFFYLRFYYAQIENAKNRQLIDNVRIVW